MNSIDRRLNKYLNKENLKKLSINNFSLKGIKSVLKLLDNPQYKYKIIHIAGTNGKGTTAHILNDILIRSGYKVGLYTSPHLLTINERIRLNNKLISNYNILKYLDIIESLNNNKFILSYFDILTLIAFLFFEKNNVDFAILETGLGGRLDSTNVGTPLISVITDISLDHQNILGNNVEEITYEKCGIIKKNSILITSNQDKKILQVIKQNAKSNNTKLFIFNKDFFALNLKLTNRKYIFDYKFNDFAITKIKTNLNTYKQLKNLLLAITVIKILFFNGFNIKNKSIIDSCKNLFIPGRLQILLKKPVLLFDPAHNISSVKTIVDYVKTNFESKKICFVVSFMEDKRPDSLIDLIKINLDCDILYFIIDTDRSYEPLSNNNIKQIYNQKQLKKLSIDIIKSNYQNVVITGTFRLYKYALKLTKKIKLFDNDCIFK